MDGFPLTVEKVVVDDVAKKPRKLDFYIVIIKDNVKYHSPEIVGLEFLTYSF